MSHNISIIHNHNLDISNVETLAHDLAELFNINIEYGHYHCCSEGLLKLLELQYDEKMIVLGKVQKGSDLPNFKLFDENIYQRLALSCFGEKVFYDEIYWLGYVEFPNENQILAEIKHAQSINFELMCCENGFCRGLNIYKECVMDNMNDYFSQWWLLCDVFVPKAEIYTVFDDDEVVDFRKELLLHSSKLGANHVYYVDDQSAVLEGLGEGDCGEMSWKEIQTFIKEKCGDLLLDIPEYFLNEEYRKMWIDRKIEPLAFVDDFRDLR